MATLEALGWDDAWEAARAGFDRVLIPGRVAETPSHGQLTALTPEPVESVLASRFHGLDLPDQPALGDWVLLRDAGGLHLVEWVLPRATVISRKAAGRTSQSQILAANVDRVFIVTDVEDDFRVRRLERYLAVILDGGAQPVVLLNKCDVPHDRERLSGALEEIRAVAPVLFVSAETGEGFSDLEPHLRGTVAFVGSSGVGKSTLVNRALGVEAQATGAVRSDDGKGRHTTSRGALLSLGSVCLLDTPGIRELGLSGAGDGLDETFPEIAELASDCHYRDCQHRGEPGCAVLAAVEQGALDAERLRSYEALRRESAWAARRSDERATRDSKGRWKEVHKGMRQRNAINRKLGLKTSE